MSGARRGWLAIAFCASATLAVACAHHPGAGTSGNISAAPRADSITVGLWHFDESGGKACADAAGRLRATAGVDTRIDFGRFGSGRQLTSSIESWIFAPYISALDTPRLTVEAWIDPDSYGSAEDTPIAGRWTEYPGEQSWLFSLVGYSRVRREFVPDAPGFHQQLVVGGTAGRLMFTFQPVEPGAPVTYFSTSEIPTGHWTHVAVTHDGTVVRFWINGQLDAQFATRTEIRPSRAPLLIGNYFDTRVLSDFGGDLSTGGRISYAPYYAFLGMIDELRISSEARSEFGVAH